MVICRNAYDEDTKTIKSLWKESFGDDVYMQYFFDILYDFKRGIVAQDFSENEKNVVAFLYRFEMQMTNLGPVSYVYAACTNKEYRKQGIMTKLLEYSEKLDKEDGYKATMLIPANESLFEFYKKRGFAKEIYCKLSEYKKEYFDNIDNMVKNIQGKTAKVIDILNINFKMFLEEQGDVINKMIKLYNHKSNFNRIVRDNDFIADRINYYKCTGGNVFVIYDNNIVKGYAFVNFDNLNVYVDELCVENDMYKIHLIKEIYKYCIKNTKDTEYDKILVKVRGFDEKTMKKYGCLKLYSEEKYEDISIGLLYD